MEKYKLEDFADLLNSEDRDNLRLAWTMIDKSIDCSKLNLRELCILNMQLNNVYHFNKEINALRNNFRSKVLKYLFKYSTSARIGMYNKIENEQTYQKGKAINI